MGGAAILVALTVLLVAAVGTFWTAGVGVVRTMLRGKTAKQIKRFWTVMMAWAAAVAVIAAVALIATR